MNFASVALNTDPVLQPGELTIELHKTEQQQSKNKVMGKKKLFVFFNHFEASNMSNQSRKSSTMDDEKWLFEPLSLKGHSVDHEKIQTSLSR